MSFPWAAKINTRTYRKRDRERWPVLRLPRKTLGWFVALALSGASSVLDIPVAKAAPPRTDLPKEATQFVVPGSGSALLPQTIGNAMTITQQTQKVILNWQSFNIGRDASVEFKQPDASSTALNRISQGRPSEIFGKLMANGQILLINQNGIVFGSGAQVNTHSFVASSIDINDQVFNNRMADAINQKTAAFDSGMSKATGFVQVDAGAVLKTDEGGRIMILAPVIESRGEINTPGGQAILAASHDKVYLANSDDKNTRGLLVEVATGGDVSNFGKIVAERGNISMVGLAVNQNGIVRATTAVNLNGSIRLVARDTVRVDPKGTGAEEHKIPFATKTGMLTLGEGSLTEVTADNTAQTAVDVQAQPVSQIELMGNQVTMKSGARIVAPAGNVTITATQDPATQGPSSIITSSDSQFLMESGSSIDVSGLNSAVLPMERNVVAVELRGSQLADSPLQRNGPLYGETVYVDARKGTTLANVKADIAKIERPVDERLAVGGKVTIVSDQNVVMQKNSAINVSGGSIRYQEGFVNTTQLVAQGKVYEIGNADPNRPYDGIYGTYKVLHKKWGVTETFNVFGEQQFARFESGYVEGRDAGSVSINARNLNSPYALGGELRGDVTAGRYQRLPQADLTGIQRQYDQLPLGGELVLGNADIVYSGLRDYTLRSPTALGATGFNRMRVYAGGNISLSEGENFALSPGGELTLTAANVDVQGGITVHGGKVSINAFGSPTTTLPDGSTALLEQKGSIDVSGQWVNDGAALHPGEAPQDPVFINGGKVTIKANGNLALQAGSLIDASGGAQLQRSGTLQYGKGGDIAITDLPLTENTSTGKPSTLQLDGELRAYSFGKGGSLSLTGAGFRIGGQQSEVPPNSLRLDPGFFQRGGFNVYNLTSTHTGISIAQNTDVRLRPMNRVLGPQFSTLATGTDLNQLGGLSVLPDFQQQPVSLDLTLTRASNVGSTALVEMESGSSIHANPGASIALSSDTNLIVNGTIAAPAGNIKLSLKQPVKDNQPSDGHTLPPPQTIRLGPQGQLLAGAIYQPVVDATGLRLGTVRDGGTVTIAATTDTSGYLIASPGSHIDVSGTTQTLDVSQGVNITPTAVNGAAGTIDITAAEGMVLNGGMTGVSGTGPGAAGGTLSVTLGMAGRPNGTIVLTDHPTLVAPGLGETDLSSLKGKAEISPGQVHDGGFDSLELHTNGLISNTDTLGQINLVGDIDLSMKGRLILDTPVLASQGGQAKLAAGYLALGPEKATLLTMPSPGHGSVLLYGQHVDLLNTLSMSGFGPSLPGAATTAPIQIVSEEDIRFIGGNLLTPDNLHAIGQLNSTADVALRANQVYTATATDYTLSVLGPDGKPAGKIAIQAGGTSEAPLSAGSRLTLSAADIEQYGTLRAPFGQIELDATENLVLGAGSVTSVSGAGQRVPFGKTELGQDWLYPLTNGSSFINGVYTAPPEKLVSLKAPQVTLAPGAVVDVTGGGDLLAREQLPGPGGTNDILNNILPNGTTNSAFAIVPTRHDLYGSVDPFLSTGSPAKPGDTIYIASGGPLPAGQYAMLPAGYALLPGAYLVTPLAKTNSPTPGQAVQQFSGAAIVAGQRGNAGTGARDSLWSAFLVENGTQVRSHSEYLESRADTFFTGSAGRLNQDAGRLVIDAAKTLTLGGTLASNAAGGFGSEVDILANKLAVVTAYTGANDRVELVDTGLNNLHADSLLLGATRQQQGADVALTVRATDVTVESGTALAAPEVMLAASDQVRVADNATISAAGSGRVGASGSILLSGDSALARVSSDGQVRVQRTASLGTTTKGTLDIAAGATLDAARSIALDASLNTNVAGDLRTHNGSLSLAGPRISLGDTQTASGGLVLTNDRLARLDASELILNSRSTIDLYGPVSMNLHRVALDAAGLTGHGNPGQGASIAADTIALSNRSGYVYTDTASLGGSGTLNLNAREVTLGAGDFKIRGFSNTTVAATEQIIAKPETNSAVQLHVAGDLTLQTARLTASKGADVLIDTQDATGAMAGKMSLTAPASPVTLAPVTDLGTKLDLAATQIDVDTHIELPSGIVSLHATGAGGVNLASNAAIDVAGRDVHFADRTVGSPGGAVTLTADQGDVRVGPQARIDVSGAPSGSDAGKLSITAPNGNVQLDPMAQLTASSHAGGRAGSFALDTGHLAGNFTALNATLNAAGFTDVRQLRLRNDNVTIAAADTVRAHDLRIAADNGQIDVLGQIDASGEQAGRVELWAQNNLYLRNGATIDAHATGTDQNGGHMLLATGVDAVTKTPGRLTLESGAKINVSGTGPTLGADGKPQRADNGELLLRAARIGNGVAIDALAADVTGASKVVVEAYKSYQASVIDDNFTNSLHGETTAYMTSAATQAQADALKAQLGAAGAAFHFRPGMEVDSPGDLTLNNSWDLRTWRDGGEAGVLTLKAAGNLYINNSLSDGVQSITNDLVSGSISIRDEVKKGQSWSYRLVGGADLSSADPLAVAQGKGDVRLDSNVQVRTGTGNIELAAGKNVQFKDSTAAVYTVGENRGLGALAAAGLTDEQVQEVLLEGDFLQNGGDIRISAGEQILGAASGLSINEWLARTGGDVPILGITKLPASWAVSLTDYSQQDVAGILTFTLRNNFQQNVGALGGGNVTVTAGGDIKNLSAVIATTGKPVGGNGTALSTDIAGGGNLQVVAGGDIKGGTFYLGKGQAHIEAGGAVTKADGASLYPILALGDGQYDVRARKDLTIESIVNPTVLARSVSQGLGGNGTFGAPLADNSALFFTYGAQSGARLEAIAGDITFNNNDNNLKEAFHSKVLNYNNESDTNALHYYPGSVSARSLQGDIIVGGTGFTLLPAPRGDLELLAGGSIIPGGVSTNILLSDADPARLPGSLSPAASSSIVNASLDPQGTNAHAATPVHLGDTQPVRIVAQDGDIGTPQGSDKQLTLSLSKQARLYAGGDVRNLALKIQNVDAGDISVVQAGGSVLFPTSRNTSGFLSTSGSDTKIFEIAGPGQFYAITGKDVDLGISSGIQTIGNQNNKALPDSGASITVMTGQAQAPDYTAFIDHYLVNQDTYSGRLVQYMQDLGVSAPAGSTTLLETFQALPLLKQRKLILDIFFNELRESGIAAGKSLGGPDYSRGFAAIKTLFPGERYPGDLKSYLSQIYTRNGGDINLVVPGGLVNAGVASATGISKPADQLGIAALGAGNVNAFVDGDFLVNSSRVYALDGGDVLMWSSVGNIDAGKGAKTALSIPSPIATYDQDGNTFLEFPASVSGSGIRADVRTPGRKPGDIYLIAPEGVVNAGDAGIGSAGNLTIAATAVLGADNIKVGGLSTGVPTDTGGLGAGLAGVGDIAATASKVAEDATRGLGTQANDNPSFLGVEVIGFGE